MTKGSNSIKSMTETKIAKKMLVIALGSNLGNRYAYIAQAKRLLQKKLGRAYKTSQVYETPPWGKTNQSSFLNSVACFSTNFPVEEGQQICLEVEKKLGRIHEERWGKRCIDVDLLFYGGEIFESDNLVIPHPELHHRAFVLRPLMDVAASFVHPKLELSVGHLFKALDENKDFEIFSSCF